MTLFSNLPAETQVKLLELAAKQAAGRESNAKNYATCLNESLKELIDAITNVDGD
jgi:hypothetical protein